MWFRFCRKRSGDISKRDQQQPIVNNDLCQCTHPDKDYSFFFLFFSRSNNFSSLSLSSVSLFRGNIEREFQILPLIRASILSRVGGMIWPGTSERSRSPGMEMNDEPYPGVSKAGFRWHLLRDNGTPVESPTKPLIGGEEKKVAGIVQER